MDFSLAFSALKASLKVTRKAWAEDLDVPVYEKTKHDNRNVLMIQSIYNTTEQQIAALLGHMT